MSNTDEKKSKDQKLRELEFLFEGERKKEKEFRNDSLYRAIFAAIIRLNYEPFFTFDIERDIHNHSPEVIEKLKEGGKEDYILGKTIGAKLRQLKFWGMLTLEGKRIRRQEKFALDEDVKEKFTEYMKELLNER